MVLTRNERANQSRAWRSRGSRRSSYRRRIRLASSWVGMGSPPRPGGLSQNARTRPLCLVSVGAPGRLALITPALFSHPSTHPSGEKRGIERARLRRGAPTEPLSPRKGGWRDGREGLGSEGPSKLAHSRLQSEAQAPTIAPFRKWPYRCTG